MKGNVYKLLKMITVGVLIMIMGSLLVNQALNTHTHVMPDGSIISHAHPFNKSQESKQGGSHQHSAPEFFLLHNLQLLFFVAFLSLILKELAREFRKVYCITGEYIPVSIVLFPGRAPPQL